MTKTGVNGRRRVQGGCRITCGAIAAKRRLCRNREIELLARGT
jgi:hypothetical protein